MTHWLCWQARCPADELATTACRTVARATASPTELRNRQLRARLE
jgi:hypothetical protein